MPAPGKSSSLVLLPTGLYTADGHGLHSPCVSCILGLYKVARRIAVWSTVWAKRFLMYAAGAYALCAGGAEAFSLAPSAGLCWPALLPAYPQVRGVSTVHDECHVGTKVLTSRQVTVQTPSC